jgi:hypothetical protein
MPDTGAPWNIPYVDPTDLVRDYPQASEDLADAIALGLSAAGNPGIGSNVLSVTKVDAFSTASTSFVEVTDMSVTITPTSATSKVLVVAMLHAGHSGADLVSFRLLRGATPIAVGASGDSTSASLRSEFGLDFPHVLTIDSPATTSATTYEIEMKVAGGTGYVNRRGFDSTIFGVSSLTAIEVKV